MPKICFKQKDDSSVTVEANCGQTLMHEALRYGIVGIIGECGGSCMCATCHIHLKDPGQFGLGGISEMEEAMLELEGVDITADSRLACQIEITPQLDGLTVTVAGTDD
jgi:2Fe-2S ferredoxin